MLIESLALPTAPATGQRFLYCGVVVAPGSWCGNNSVRHRYDGQEVVSGGDSRAGERMRFDSNPGNIRYPGPTDSSLNYHAYCYAPAGATDFLFQAEARQRNDLGRNHTVTGYAYYGTLSPRLCR